MTVSDNAIIYLEHFIGRYSRKGLQHSSAKGNSKVTDGVEMTPPGHRETSRRAIGMIARIQCLARAEAWAMTGPQRQASARNPRRFPDKLRVCNWNVAIIVERDPTLPLPSCAPNDDKGRRQKGHPSKSFKGRGDCQLYRDSSPLATMAKGELYRNDRTAPASSSPPLATMAKADWHYRDRKAR